MSAAVIRWRRRVLPIGAAVLCMTTGIVRAGWQDDPLSTSDNLPIRAEQRVASAGLTPCGDGVPRVPLTLLDTVRRALCVNPATRQAWAAVEAQAAAVGIGKSAFLPSLSFSASVATVNGRDRYSDLPELNSSMHGTSDEETLGLNWLVYDFGLRAANLRRERALLEAAAADQDEAVQVAFVSAAKDYFSAEQAQASLSAALETEQAAKHSMEAVEVRVGAGVGAEADRLQAKTAYLQASLDRIRARENEQNAMGRLALSIGLRPGAALSLAPPPEAPAEMAQVSAMIDPLIERAMRANPRITAAQQQWLAARDAVDAAAAGGRPTLALAAVGDRATNPVNRVTTQQTIETSSIGLQLSIPLFEGFSRTYRLRRAQAEAGGKAANLLAIRQEVSRDVWESYVAVRGSTDNLTASKTLMDTAAESFAIALGRYKSGVGGVVELLKAQSDMAAAREEYVRSRTLWRLSRLQLAASLGSIDFASLRQ